MSDQPDVHDPNPAHTAFPDAEQLAAVNPGPASAPHGRGRGLRVAMIALEFEGVDFEGQRVTLKMGEVVGAVEMRDGSAHVLIGLTTSYLKTSYNDFMTIWRDSGYI